MDKRTVDLIIRIVDSYIQSAQPVGSGALVEKYRMGISSATIRNIMATLEEEGYMTQPHSSAGRIPTARSYEVYIQYVRPTRLPSRSEQDLEELVSSDCADDAFLRHMVKLLSDASGDVAFATLGGRIQFAGLSRMSEKPEFQEESFRSAILSVLDDLHNIVEAVALRATEEPQVLVGEQSNLSPECSAIVMRFIHRGRDGIVALVGPMRMNYGKNISLMNSLKNIITHHV